jgi:hypothetical protein
MARRTKSSPGRRPLRSPLLVEALEDRCVPASTALQAGGVLTLTADSVTLNTTILIAETSTSGTYAVTMSDDGTQVVCQTFSGVTDILVNGGSGNTTVDLSGNVTSGTGLSGNLTINSSGALTVNDGIGDDNAPAFNVFGQVNISDTGGGPLNVTTGGTGTTLGATTITGSSSGADSIALEGSTIINGTLDLVMGGGGDSISLEGTTVSGAVSFQAASGGDSISITNSSVGDLNLQSVQALFLDNAQVTGNLTTYFTAEQDVTFSDGTEVQGFVSLNGQGDSQAQVSISASKVDDFFSVEAGQGVDSAGNDSINFTDDHMGSAVALQLGSGSDTVNLEATTLDRRLLVQGTGTLILSVDQSTVGGFVSVNETGSTSADTVSVTASTIDGFLSVRKGDGTDTVGNEFISLNNTTIADNFGASLDPGNDTVTINSTDIRGRVFVDSTGNLDFVMNTSEVGSFVSLNQVGSTSSDTVSVSQSEVGRFFSVTSGDGTDTSGSNSISFENTSIGDSFGANLDGGNDTVSLTSTTVGGSVFINGTGNLDFTFTGGSMTRGSINLNMTGTASADTVTVCEGTVGRQLTIDSGSGNDSIGVHNADIGGAVVADLGSGTDTVSLTSTAIGSDFDVTNTGTASVYLTDTSVAGNLSLSLGTGNDTVTLTGVAVSGGAAITTAGGNDSITMTTSILKGSTSIDTGAGADTITVEPNTGDGGTTTFFGSVTMSGTGNLTIALGSSPSDLAVFFGAANFTGGEAGSSLAKTDAQFNGGSPTIAGFTTVTG